MQIKLNNKTLNISVEQATPDGMEKFSTIVIFKGDFKRYSEDRNVKSVWDFTDFYKRNPNLMLALPIYEKDMNLTMEANDEIVGYICVDKTDYENFYGKKFPENLSKEDVDEINSEYVRELSTINDCFNGELLTTKISLMVDGKQTNAESLYSYEGDIEYLIENSDTLTENPEFLEPLKNDIEKLKEEIALEFEDEREDIEEDIEDEETKIVRVLIKEPGKEPYEKEIEDKLSVLQGIVGGYIECVEMPGVRNVDLYVNEEGKLNKLPGNFWLPEYEDCACGTVYMVGFDPDSGENISLTDNQIKKCKAYCKTYELPKGLDLYEDYYIVKACMIERYKHQQKKNAEM